MRQSGFAAFPRGVGEKLPHVLEGFGDGEDAFFVVAEFVGIKGVIVDCGGHVEAHRAALSGFVGVDVGGRLLDPLGDEVRGPVEGGDGLDDAAMGASEGADLAVAPRLLGDPLDGVEPVFAFPRVAGVVVAAVAFGFEARAEVLVDEDVAVAGVVVTDGVPLVFGLVVGGADEEDGCGFGDGFAIFVDGEVCVGGEADAVAHGDHEFLVVVVGVEI